MPAPIEFYFDFSSPYGYMAAEKIDALGAKHGRSTDWHPVLLGAIFKVTGGQPPAGVPIKGDYFKHDFARSARLLGVPYRHPSIFPISSVAPSRAVYWLKDRDAEKSKTLARALYHAFFVEDRDIQNVEVVMDVAVTLGIKRDELTAALNDPAVKDRLKNEVQQAMDKGVFGSPYIIIDGEPFFGADRLDQVDKWLATGGW
ncbi:MAG: 2-hydroxychromene-2-carboxylate isomerase [Burkholderiales bacterium]